MTPFRLFYKFVLPIVLMATALIESFAAAAFMGNQPNDFAVLCGTLIVPAVILACAGAARLLWFRRR